MQTVVITAIALLGLLSQVAAQAPAYQTATPQVDKFVRDVVLCGHQAKTMRWLTLPRLNITSNSPEMKDFVERGFASISQATGLSATGDGVVHVFIGSGRDLTKQEIVQRKNLTVVGKDGCLFWQNKDQSLKEAFIFVKDTAGNTEEQRRHLLFHDLLAAFGFMKNSPVFPDSTFGANTTYDLQLSPLDVQLISFSYRQLPPGSLSSDVTKLLKLHWNK